MPKSIRSLFNSSRADVETLHVTLVFLVTLAVNCWLVPYGFLELASEGVLFKPAIDLLEGRMLFRDTFSQYGPLGIWMEAGALAVFGRRLLVVKYQTAFLLALAAIFLWKSWRQVLPLWWATISTLIWTFAGYYFVATYLAWASTFAIFFQSIALASLLAYREQSNPRHLVVAGAMGAAATFCKQNVGVYLLAAMAATLVLWWVIDRCARPKQLLFQPILRLCLGAFGVVAVVLGVLVLTGALEHWWAQNIRWPAAWGATYGGGYSPKTILSCLTILPDRWNADLRLAPMLYRLLPMISLGLFAPLVLEAWRLPENKRLAQLAGLSLVSFASWLQYFPVPGIGQLWWGSTPMFGLVIALIYTLVESFQQQIHRPAMRHGLVALMVIALFAPMLARQFRSVSILHAPLNTVIGGDSPFTGIIETPQRAALIMDLEAAFRQTVGISEPEHDFILAGDEGMLLTMLPGIRTFHPMYPIEYEQPIRLLYPQFDLEMQTYIAAKRPWVVGQIPSVSRFLARFPDYEVRTTVQGIYALAAPRSRSGQLP